MFRTRPWLTIATDVRDLPHRPRILALAIRRSLPAGIAVGWLLWSALLASATETEFWQPYQRADEKTYFLATCEDDAPPLGTAQVGRAETVGTVAYVDGRFGRAVQLDGHGALRYQPTAIFPDGQVALEAWIKLDRYPDKRAYIVCHPPQVDGQSSYNPQADVTKGFSLLVDHHGALHLEITNCFYGATIPTSSPPGAVPLGKWVHVAGVSNNFPIGFRRLFVDGHEVQAVAITWGQGLMVQQDEEQRPGPIYLGNDATGQAGLAGLIDQVRIHRAIVKFWPNEDEAWTTANRPGAMPSGPPHFLAGHQPLLHLPLDGNLQTQGEPLEGLQVRGGDRFVPGVCGQAHAGQLELSAPRLLDLRQGAVEFWLRPVGTNSYSDPNYGFVGGPFIFYIYNSGTLENKPLTLYFRKADGELHFLSAGDFETHPGRWYHFVITWRDDELAIYVDGRLGGRSFGVPLAPPAGGGVCRQLNLSAPGSLLDEVYLYRHSLEPEEAANAYHRYRDSTKLASVPPRSVRLRAQYFPSSQRIFYRLQANVPESQIAQVALTLRDGQHQELLRRTVPWSSAEQTLDIPDLANGQFTLSASIVAADGHEQAGDTFVFRRQHFAWERQPLGSTDEIYPPFEPVRVEGDTARVVQRQYTLNGFGLLQHVVSDAREILAGPVVVRYQTAAGEGRWDSVAGKFTTVRPNLAIYDGEAKSPSVMLRTRSSLEIDGCLKIEMSLLPGTPGRAEKTAPSPRYSGERGGVRGGPANAELVHRPFANADDADQSSATSAAASSVPATIVQRLWLEIPLCADEVPLLHTVTAGVRQNYAGATPPGQGVVWDGSRAHQYQRWLNAFVPYIWLGSPRRGLAWFAENDKGWCTQKTRDVPVQELVREGDRVILRVYLVNQPTALTQRHDLVFGLQASPTKPLADDWRLRLPDAPGGLAVVPWGGLQCASQAPFRDDWQIVEKILEPRDGRPYDAAWFARYFEQQRPPPAHGNWPWLDQVHHFAGRAQACGPTKPLAVYQEEMRGCAARPEWAVFQDEWTTEPQRFQRTELPDRVFATGYDSLADPQTITFPTSYQDFGCSIADQWLRRGVSLYWDNTYPYVATNARTTSAYVAEDGRVQPCMIIWNHREYTKRTWHLLQQWRRQRREPLEFTLHMTNTLLLPVHTWGTVNLDHELATQVPFSPEWLQTETIGRQVGNLPLSLYDLTGQGQPALAGLPPEEQALVEWGMRAVHEIGRSGPQEQVLRQFGYGTPATAVHNYWAQRPALTVRPERVKWLAVAQPAEKSCLLVLASWSTQSERVEVTVDPQVLGFSADGPVRDLAFHRELGEMKGNRFTCELPYKYQVKFLRVGASP